MSSARAADWIVIPGSCRPQSLAFGDPVRGCGDCPRQLPGIERNDAVNARLSAKIGSLALRTARKPESAHRL